MSVFNLFPGELVQSDSGSNIDVALVTDADIEERYVGGEVRIVVEQARYPLKQIPDVVQSADYNLQPDFQRRPRWDREKQSRLIESLILNVPIPPIFLYEQDYGRYEVMDGRQRLTAISEYYADKFCLEGLLEWPELNGRLYSKLPEQVRRGIDRRFLSAIVLLHETTKLPEQADRIKQLVFERINSGGEDLTSQEKRNALFPGNMNKMCVRLARHDKLCKMWGILPPASDESQDGWVPPAELSSNDFYKTMQDVELVLRFFAHRQRHTLWRGGTRFDDYLNMYLRESNSFSEEVLGNLEDLFKKTADLTYDVLGERAFWLWRARAGSHVWIDRPAYVAYDPVMAGFSKLISHGDVLRSRLDDISNDIREFYEINHTSFDGRKTNPSDLRRRDDLFFEFLSKYIA